MPFTYKQLNTYPFEKLLFEGTKSELTLVTSTYIDYYSHMLYNLFPFFYSW
jgi:hypothetical protein